MAYTVPVILNGTTYVYDMANAVRLGDFAGLNFAQQCYRCDGPIPNLTVFFRPDADGKRMEVVFELGRVWGAANAAAAHLSSYTAQVLKDGVSISPVVTVPAHYWQSRWRWQSAPRPIIRSWSQLLAAKLIPPYGKAGIPGTIVPIDPRQYVYSKPMDNAGVDKYMPQTGGRPAIGLFTEIAANAIANPNDSASQLAMLSWGEAAGSVPNFIRDEKTNAIVSVVTYPQFNTTQVNRGGTWSMGNASLYDPADPNRVPTSGWTPDTAHYPALSFAPFIATGDPYFLENLQAEAIEPFIETAYWSQGAAYLNRDQDRAYWWGLRALLTARRACELAEQNGPLPSWILGSAHYKTILGNQLTQFTNVWMNNPTRAGTVFSAGPEIGTAATWQGDFGVQVLNLGVWFGYDEWRPPLVWKSKSTIDRVNLYQAYPSFYWLPLGLGLGRACEPGAPGNPKAADYYPDWPSVVAGYVTADPSQWKPGDYTHLQADPANGGKLAGGCDPNYALQAWAALAFSAANGVPGADAARAKIAPLVQYQTARTAFMASAAGTVIVPPPVVTPQDPPPVTPPEKLPATLPGIVTRVSRLKTIVGA